MPNRISPTKRTRAPRRLPRRLLLLLTIGGLTVTACGATTAENPNGTSGADRPQIVATTAILGDVLAHIVGDVADVTVLVPRDENPANYRPTAEDTDELNDADLIVMIGLDYEERSLDAIDEAAEHGAEVFELGPELEPIPYTGSSEDPEAEEVLDPFVWMDPHRMGEAIPILTDRLGQLSTPLAELETADRADSYADELRTTEADMTDILDTVDEDRRILITEAEGLAYLAERFDYELVDIGNEGRIPDARLGTRELSRLEEAVDDLGVNVLFIRQLPGSSVVDQIEEHFEGEITVVQLWVDTLSEPDGNASDYLDLLHTDATLIAEALATGSD
jgi:zinc/manganese transport system substrate-binding protein